MSEGNGRLADPGAQLERTNLAWGRTSFSIAACGALLVREGLVDGQPLLVAAGGVTLGVAGVLWILVATRYVRKRSTEARHLLAGHPYAVRGITLLVALVSCMSMFAALLLR